MGRHSVVRSKRGIRMEDGELRFGRFRVDSEEFQALKNNVLSMVLSLGAVVAIIWLGVWALVSLMGASPSYASDQTQVATAGYKPLPASSGSTKEPMPLPAGSQTVKVSPPVAAKTNSVTGNGTCARPVPNGIKAGDGWLAIRDRKRNGKTVWIPDHRGVDLSSYMNTPIYAVRSGTVLYAGLTNDGFGAIVKLQHADGSQTWYGHVDSWLVQKGQQVKQGQEIAKMGTRGHSSGPHLHFEIHPGGGPAIDPVAWFKNTCGITFEREPKHGGS